MTKCVDFARRYQAATSCSARTPRRSKLVWETSQQECGVSIRKLLEDCHYKNKTFEVSECMNVDERSIVRTPFRRLTFPWRDADPRIIGISRMAELRNER